LAPESRAVLALVLAQGRSYGDIAAMLHIEESDVRVRAQGATRGLVTTAGRPGADAETRITDYVLGEQSVSERAGTRAMIAASPVARAWAVELTDALAPLAKSPLPAIPEARIEPPAVDEPAAQPELPAETLPIVDSTTVLSEHVSTEQGSGAFEPAPFEAEREGDSEFEPLGQPAMESEHTTTARATRRPSRWQTRYGVAALIAVAIVALLIAALNKSGSSPSHTVSSPLLRVALVPAGSNLRAGGTATVEAQNGGRLLLIAAHGLAPNRRNAYAVWLYNSRRDARLLGFVPSTSGTFSASVRLPADAPKYHYLIVTLERSSRPTAPGSVVLRTPLALP
jgi:hypothetical protein